MTVPGARRSSFKIMSLDFRFRELQSDLFLSLFEAGDVKMKVCCNQVHVKDLLGRQVPVRAAMNILNAFLVISISRSGVSVLPFTFIHMLRLILSIGPNLMDSW